MAPGDDADKPVAHCPRRGIRGLLSLHLPTLKSSYEGLRRDCSLREQALYECGHYNFRLLIGTDTQRFRVNPGPRWQCCRSSKDEYVARCVRRAPGEGRAARVYFNLQL